MIDSSQLIKWIIAEYIEIYSGSDEQLKYYAAEFEHKKYDFVNEKSRNLIWMMVR